MNGLQQSDFLHGSSGLQVSVSHPGGRNSLTSSDLASETKRHHFQHVLVVTSNSQTSGSNREQANPTSQWEECQGSRKICGMGNVIAALFGNYSLASFSTNLSPTLVQSVPKVGHILPTPILNGNSLLRSLNSSASKTLSFPFVF